MLSVIMNSRDRMIVSAALLLREKGLTGTSFGDVIDHKRQWRGSIYPHFPNGKAQLVEGAMQAADGYVAGSIENRDPLEALRSFEQGRRLRAHQGELGGG